MPKQLRVAALTGKIYDAVIGKDGFMTGNKTDRTDECINAVAVHMKFEADHNKDESGYFSYQWPGEGVLVWESENKDGLHEGN